MTLARRSGAILLLALAVTPARSSANTTVSVYGSGLVDPQEMAFGAAGYLFVGRSRKGSSSVPAPLTTIYRIPPGGGQAETCGGNAFVDPDGIAVDEDGATLWVTSATGYWCQQLHGRLLSVAASDCQRRHLDCTAGVDDEYLRNPTSLALDRTGRFGAPGSFLVAQRRCTYPGVNARTQVLNVSRACERIVLPELSDFGVIRDLCFDSEGNLWFVGGSRLCQWAAGDDPKRIPLSADVTAVGFDPIHETLLVGLDTPGDPQVVRVSLDGRMGPALARGISARSFAFDDCGNIYVADEVHDVVWKIAGEGDFDLDGDVDLADFDHFQTCFTGPATDVGAPELSPCCEGADYDGDSDVDLPDFRAFVLSFTGPR